MTAPLLPLSGKVALVTGAAGGIGRATAVALARAGADVATNDLQFPAEGGVAAEVIAAGRRALTCSADVSDQVAVEAMVGAHGGRTWPTGHFRVLSCF